MLIIVKSILLLLVCNSKLISAYPIDPRIEGPLENDKQLINPTGSRLLMEEKRPLIKFPYNSGYLEVKRTDKGTDKSMMADRLVLAKSHESQASN